MELRPYQSSCVDAVLGARTAGKKRVLYVLPTGCGKTQTFCKIVDTIVREERRPAMILAHRDELLDQAEKRMRGMFPHLRVSTEAGQRRASNMAHVVVSSVQTLGRKGSERLPWLADKGASVIVVDEAHRAAADSYQRVFERFGAFDDRAFLVGCTATPKRLDRKALHGVHGATFEAEVYRYEIRQAIKDGWLCQIRGFRVVSDVNLDNIKNVGGDFNQGELIKAVNVETRTRKAVNHWFEIAVGRKTIVFCASVEHAENAAKAWRDRGIAAECVHGDLPKESRKAMLGRFNTGETQVLTNVEVLTEGFDQPDISCVVMLRPTQSWGLYTQMAGRGTRLAPGKEDCLIIDVVDNCRKHSLATVPAIIDLPPGLDLQGHSISEAADKLEELGEKAAVLVNAQPDKFEDINSMLQDVDLFANVDPPAEVINSSDFNWLAINNGYFLSCGSGRSAKIHTDSLGDFHLEIHDTEYEGVQTISLASEPGYSLSLADRHVLERWPDAGAVARRNTRWRGEPPSEKQIHLLTRKGYSVVAVNAMTKGQASALISKIFAAKDNSRAYCGSGDLWAK